MSSEDERHIGFLISDVARLMRTAFDRRVRDLGLTRSQWLVINRLHRRPGATQSELAEMLEVEKATAGRMVDRMEKKGWVVRGPDAADRRVNRLHLTAEADLIQVRLAEIADRTVDDALALLSGRQREQFSELMRRVKRQLQSMLEPEFAEADEPAEELVPVIRPHPKVIRVVLLVAVPFLLVTIGGAVWLHGGRTVGTEDAYVKADIAQIAPEVAGRVVEVLVRDHEAVKAGAPLVKIDPEPFRLALDKAEAELDNARTGVETARAQYQETMSELAEVQSQGEYLTRQAARQQALAATGAASITKLEEAQNAAAVARDRIGVVKRRLTRMLAALVGNPEIATDDHPLVREKRAERDRAALDLKRTTIMAPIAGTAVNVKLQPGEQVKAATPLFVVVAKTRPWVEANMKETDLTHVKPGQKARVVLDIYPDVTWAAEIDSISPATGAEFAILPPQNASGNWVKVVQRLPVRVRLLPHQGEPPLRAGMTATVTIDIRRQRSLAGLIQGSASAASPE